MLYEKTGCARRKLREKDIPYNIAEEIQGQEKKINKRSRFV